jgi:hypothetical protein
MQTYEKKTILCVYIYKKITNQPLLWHNKTLFQFIHSNYYGEIMT